MNNFDKLYKDTLIPLCEEEIATVGFFPGCFSPPHLGHYATAKAMAMKNRHAYVIASDSCRDPRITTEKMVAIWKIYLEAMSMSNISVKVVAGSPVGVTYQSVNLLNNKGKLVMAKPVEINRDAQEIYEEIGKRKTEVTLFAGREDFRGRYSAFFKDENNPYRGKNVINIIEGTVDRHASGTETRETITNIAIGKQDADTLRNLLPGPSGSFNRDGPRDLSPEQEDQVISILLSK